MLMYERADHSALFCREAIELYGERPAVLIGQSDALPSLSVLRDVRVLRLRDDGWVELTELVEGRPHLAEWMTGCVADHPLLNPGLVALPQGLLDTLERIVAVLDDVVPLRVGRKQQAFRRLRSEPAFFELRSELLVAAKVAAAGVPFEFPAHAPDLVLDGKLGVEIGCRTLDAPWWLNQELTRLLPAERLGIELVFDGQPLHLARARLIEIALSIVDSCESATVRTTLRYEDVGLTVRLFPVPDGCGPSLTFGLSHPLSSDMSAHFAEVEREIENKLVEKARQASAIPTALLLDFARVGKSWLRPDAVWEPRLQALVEPSAFSRRGSSRTRSSTKSK